MKLTISVKQAGKKHALIDKKIIEVDELGAMPTLAELINAVVAQQVQEYNSKPHEKNLLPFLSKEAIRDQADGGKVGFGSIYNDHKARISEAQEVAIQAFEDSLYVIFVNDEEYTKPDQIISLKQDTVITFIRLTFLAGSYW